MVDSRSGTKLRSPDSSLKDLMLCFSIWWRMEEEKKQQRKEKRHNGKGIFLPSEGPTFSPYPWPALSPSCDTEGPSAKEDWLFLSRICTQNFTFFIHFLGFCLQCRNPGSLPGLGRSPGEQIGYPWASLMVQLVKNLPAMRKTWVQFLAWEDPLEKGTASYPLQQSCLENSMDCIVHGVSKSQTGLSDFHVTSFHTFSIHLCADYGSPTSSLFLIC